MSYARYSGISGSGGGGGGGNITDINGQVGPSVTIAAGTGISVSALSNIITVSNTGSVPTGNPNTFAGFDGTGNLESIPGWGINTITGGASELITLTPADSVGGQTDIINNFQNTITPTANLVNLSHINMQNYMYLNGPFDMTSFINYSSGVSVSDVGNKGFIGLYTGTIGLGDGTNTSSTQGAEAFYTNIFVNDNHTDNQSLRSLNSIIGVGNLGTASQITLQSLSINVDGTVNNGVEIININGNINSALPVNVGYNGINHNVNFHNTIQYYNGILSGGNFDTGTNVTNSIQQFQDNGHLATGATAGGYSSFGAFPNFDAGSTLTNGYGGFNIAPNFNGSMGTGGFNGYGIGAQFTVATQYFNGFGSFANFNSGSSVVNGIQPFVDNNNIQSGATASYYSSFSANPSFQTGSTCTGSFNGININPNFDINVPNVVLAQLNGHGSGTTPALIGLQINLSQINSTAQKKGIEVNDGNIQLNAQYDTSILPASPGFLNINGIGGLFRVAPGFPVTNTLGLANQFGVSAVFEDDYGPDPFLGSLGFANINLANQMIIAATKTVSAYNHVLLAVSLPSGGALSPPITDTGSLTDAYLLRMPGFLPQGGTPSLTNMYQIYMDNIGGSSVAANAWGLYIADPALQNYFAGSININTSTGKVSNSSVALEIGGTDKAFRQPNLTTTQRNALTPLAGMEIFNTSSGAVEYYNGTVWVNPAAGTGQNYYVEKFTLTGTDITNGFVTLANTPTVAANVNVDVIGGILQDYGTDYTVIGSNVDWNGLFLDGVLVAGDKLVITYY